MKFLKKKNLEALEFNLKKKSIHPDWVEELIKEGHFFSHKKDSCTNFDCVLDSKYLLSLTHSQILDNNFLLN